MLSRVALAAAGVLFACGVFEIALRVAQPVSSVATPLVSFHQSDPLLGWRGRPDITLRFRRPDFDVLVSHGPEGWRRPEPPPPDGAAARVLVLGDSFTWGWGVGQGELFTDVIQRELSPRVAVHNRGINAVGTAQEYLLLRAELARADWDRVLLMFFKNDLHDNVKSKRGRRPYFELVGDELVPRNQPAAPLMSPLRASLAHHSRVFQLVDLQNILLREWLDDERPPAELRDDAELDERALPGADVTARLLVEMRRACEAQGARFALVYVPHPSELAGFPSSDPQIRAVRRWLERLAAREGLVVVDLAPAFRAEARRGRRLVYPHDEHWTPEGHRLAAELLLASPILR